MTTPNIGLTELSNSAGQYLNANETFAVIDALLQTRAISKSLISAPGVPGDGDVYIMASAWPGITTMGGAACADGDIALYRTGFGAFKAIRPKEGWKIEVAADDQEYRFNGTTWIAITGGGGVSLPVIRAITANESLGLSHINTFGVNSTTSNYTQTIPAQAAVAWTADAEIHFLPSNTGDITITAAAGVSLNGVVAGSVTLSTQNGAASIKRTAADTWWVGGSLGTQAEQQAALGLTGASLEWTTYGGTANAITLTPLVARSAYVTGDKVRFRATATNTGATTINVSGLGVKTCVTVTGAALPTGYIRTGVDTEAVYDGANFIVRRLIERGSNANGEYTRREDGSQTCTHSLNLVDNTVGTGLRVSWTLPAAYSSAPKFAAVPDLIAGGVAAANRGDFGVVFGQSTTTAINNIDMYKVPGATIVTTSVSVPCLLTASGRWY